MAETPLQPNGSRALEKTVFSIPGSDLEEPQRSSPTETSLVHNQTSQLPEVPVFGSERPIRLELHNKEEETAFLSSTQASSSSLSNETPAFRIICQTPKIPKKPVKYSAKELQKKKVLALINSSASYKFHFSMLQPHTIRICVTIGEQDSSYDHILYLEEMEKLLQSGISTYVMGQFTLNLPETLKLLEKTYYS